MPHRLDVELTSAKDTETFTWRAAKARQPKGTVSSSLLPAGSKVGDVFRVEAEIEMEGMRILCVVPTKEKDAPTGRIEVVGSQTPVAGVTTVLAGKDSRRRESPFFRDGSERRDRGEGGGRGRGREGTRVASARAAAPGSEADQPDTKDRSRAPRPEGDRDRRPRPEGDRDRRPPPRRDHAEGGDRPPTSRPRRTTEATESGGERHQGAPRGPRENRDGRDARAGERTAPPRKAPFRLEVGSKHRDELLDGLVAEQRAIAERLAAAAGSLPSLRKAIADEQERAKAEGRPFDGGEQILAVAEQLHPDVKAAMWLDRAEAAVAHIDELSLRDLRAIVVAGAPRTDLGRELERTLREGHDKRVAKLRTDWEQFLTQALNDGRVLQALRLSARPPEPTARFPAALVETLATQAGAAMSATAAPDRWLALLAAAELSPVKRQIHPAGIPADESGEVHRKASEAAGRIPALAALLGMAMPPPPQPLPGERPVRPHPPRPGRGPRPGGARGPRPASGARAKAVPLGTTVLATEGAALSASSAAPVVEPPAPVVEPPAPVVEPPAPVVEPPAPVVEPPAPVVEPPAPVVEPVVEPQAPVVEPSALSLQAAAPVDTSPAEATPAAIVEAAPPVEPGIAEAPLAGLHAEPAVAEAAPEPAVAEAAPEPAPAQPDSTGTQG
jgi:hypothetical protein